MVYLVVPGLFDPPGGLDSVARRLPNLERLLALGQSAPAPIGYAETLFDLFGVDCPSDQDPPTAAIEWLAETGRPPESPVFRAWPVHLSPDQDRLLLFPVAPAELSPSAVKELIEVFNRHFAEDRLTLIARPSGRWYLFNGSERCPRLRTAPLDAVCGRNIDTFLPVGEDGRGWRQRLNEAQMLLHDLPLNTRRAAAGRPVINGIWLYGGGVLPVSPAEIRDAAPSRDAPLLLRGLQRVAASAAFAGDELHADESLLEAAIAADAETWLAAAGRLDGRVGRCLRQASEFTLLTCDGRQWVWQRRMRYRFWRRRRPVLSYRTVPPRL